MRYFMYASDGRTKFKYCILVPQISGTDIMREYITPYKINPNEVVVLSLHKTGKKTPVKDMKEYAKDLWEAFKDMDIQHIIVGDADYYKVLSGNKSAETSIGYVNTTFDNQKIIYVPNYRTVFYDPELVRSKIEHSMKALRDFENGSYIEPGKHIIHNASYPHTTELIKKELQKLFDLNQDVTCDIEGFSLKHYSAGVGTISFATSQHDGVAFEVDLYPEQKNFLVHPQETRGAIRSMLRDFFIHFPNKIIFHNASYDVTVLIYQLFMNHIEDTEGLLYGLEVFMEKIEDTKLIAYLATNTCAGNTLGLKPLSHEFSGNYSVDEITDITKIPVSELLQYNLIDCLSTWYVYNKYTPIMIADNQLSVYEEVFKPALADIIQMQLTGMPISPDKVAHARKLMEKDRNDAQAIINENSKVQEYIYLLKESWVIDKNATLKKKRVTLADAPDMELNPDSPKQLQGLLFEQLGLPVKAYTTTKQPSTKGDVIKSLKNFTSDPDTLELLDAIVAYKDVIIILNTFITAFEKAIQGPSGQWYLYGNFNLGGTVSGRLSSNGPNLQNIPSSGTKYAKIIKDCFVTQHGWLFVGLDFDSLEDRISALTTKDTNKLKVYIDGYDGHCLRAQFYFDDQMPDIDPNSVESINSIKKKYEDLRQESKTPTFLLTYGGTWMGIVDKMGWTEAKAKMVDTKYHELYAESDKWVQDKLNQASIDGYVTAAFGLRVRTPLLSQVIRGNKATPYEAEAEGRTAGNALGQSWGLLNTRAWTAFMKKVRASKYRLDIRPCAQIHDAGYAIIRDDPEVILWMNKHLVEEVKWQDHPDIWHDEVKLGGSLSIFFPSWANELNLPNELTPELLNDLCEKHINKLEDKK